METPETWARAHVGVGASDLVGAAAAGARVSAPAATDTVLLLLAGVVAALFLATLGFAAYAVVLRVRHQRQERLWAQLRERWEEPLLGALADPRGEAAVHVEVEPKTELRFVRFVLEYSRRLRGSEHAILRRLAGPYLDRVAAQVDDPRAEVRNRAVQTLGALGLPEHQGTVLRALDDGEDLVSMVAARGLARVGEAEYVGPVLKHLHRFASWDPRFLASMLAYMGADVAPALLAGLGDGTRAPRERVVYAEALRMQRDPRAGNLAARALETSDDLDLSASLLRLLAVVGRAEHLPVIRACASSGHEVIRGQSFHALGEVGDPEDRPVLEEGMNDRSPWAALHAARGVRAMGGTTMLAELASGQGPLASLAGQVMGEEVRA